MASESEVGGLVLTQTTGKKVGGSGFEVFFFVKSKGTLI